MQRLFKFRYHKLILLIFVAILAYILFSNPTIQEYVSKLDSLNYFGIFIGGILLAFGFTAPIATGYFIISNPENIWLAVLIGGLGSVLADIIVFKIIRYTFLDEFNQLENTHFIKKLSRTIKEEIGSKLKAYLIYALAGILIATPLPDEIGVIMLAGLTHIKARYLAIISFILHSIGILILLSL